MRKLLLLVAIFAVSLALCACSTVTGEPDTTIDSESEAVSAVKNYDDYYMGTNGLIGSKLGLKFYSAPDYGTCHAEQNADGSWTVTLYGNMSGYIDDAKTDYEFIGFKCIATVSSYEDVHIDSVEPVD